VHLSGLQISWALERCPGAGHPRPATSSIGVTRRDRRSDRGEARSYGLATLPPPTCRQRPMRRRRSRHRRKFKGHCGRELECAQAAARQARSTSRKHRMRQRIEGDARGTQPARPKGQLGPQHAAGGSAKRAITAENVSIAVPGGGRSLLRVQPYDFQPRKTGSGSSARRPQANFQLLDLIAGRRAGRSGQPRNGSTVRSWGLLRPQNRAEGSGRWPVACEPLISDPEGATASQGPSRPRRFGPSPAATRDTDCGLYS